MTAPSWPAKLPKKDADPNNYMDVCVETLRIVEPLKGEPLVAFWAWDMDDASNTQTVFFRPKDFAPGAKRWASLKTEVADQFVCADGLFILENETDDEGEGCGGVHQFAAYEHKRSMRILGHVVKGMHGTSDHHIYVVGESDESCPSGIQHFDGKDWKPVVVADLGDEASFRAVYAHGDGGVAVGEDGCVVELNKRSGRVLQTPLKGRLHCVYINTDGVVSIGGEDGIMQGARNALKRVKLPKDHTLAEGTCVYRGKQYWALAGDEGMGSIFVQEGGTFTAVWEGDACAHLTASEDFLYGSFEGGAARFDGENWKLLAIDWSDDKHQWTLDEATDGEEEDDEA